MQGWEPTQSVACLSPRPLQTRRAQRPSSCEDLETQKLLATGLDWCQTNCVCVLSPHYLLACKSQ